MPQVPLAVWDLLDQREQQDLLVRQEIKEQLAQLDPLVRQEYVVLLDQQDPLVVLEIRGRQDQRV